MRGTHPEDGRCIKCGHPLRKSQERLADRPGTRVHAGDGLCYTDWRQAKNTQGQAQPTTATRAALDRYLSSRRNTSTKQLLTNGGSTR